MNNKVKILLPNEKSITSEDVDLFLSVDLSQQFNEFKKERFDNDFDLAEQFAKERNASRNYIIYGVLDSTIVDCVGLPIKVYSDSGRTQQIAVIFPTSISYGQNNVFGKQKGKYYIKLENYPYDHVYFRIETNHFSYRDQDWEQRLVFIDADGNYVPYGTQTIDINAEGSSIIIENDFPFFFNKHWIKSDYNIIEEKKAKVSFNIGTQTLTEGQSGQLVLSLNKPSPFGLEMIRVEIDENSSFSNSYTQTVFSVQGSNPILRIGSQNQTLAQYNNKISFIINVPSEKQSLISAGLQLSILNGSYIGEYTILYSTLSAIDSGPDLYQIIVDAEYDQFGTNGVAPDVRFGTQPDISFSMNGQPVLFPLDVSWQENEEEKILDFNVNTDYEVEFTEFVDLTISGLLNCDEGQIVQSRIIFEDVTPRRYVSLFLGPTYENGVVFTGRTYLALNGTTNSGTMPSYSILRNGYRFEGRSEEFYPSMGYTLKITNEGDRTLFPVNPEIGITSDSTFDTGETKKFYLPTKYISPQKHSIKLSFRSQFGQISGINSEFAQAHGGRPYMVKLNTMNLMTLWMTTGYEAFKIATNGGSYDVYNLFNIERPFDIEYDDTSFSVIMTSKSPGVKLDLLTNDETITANTLSSFFEKSQEEYNIKLLANSDQNSIAAYSFAFESNGFRNLVIPRSELAASEEAVPYYLVTSYGSIMRPYQDDIEQPYYGTASTIDNLYYYQIDEAYPSYMYKGSALINGIAFLADNNVYGTKENLTQYGLGDDQFYAGFLPERISPLPGTFEPILLESTTKVVELTIPPYSSVETPPYTRSFDFTFGNPGGEVVYTFGGTQYTLRNNAEWWWFNLIPAVDQSSTQLPIATLQQRLDTGDGNTIGSGPVNGQLIDSNTIRFSSKTNGYNFHIDNIVNYNNTNEAGHIIQRELVPNILQGDVNTANNGMGGFSV